MCGDGLLHLKRGEGNNSPFRQYLFSLEKITVAGGNAKQFVPTLMRINLSERTLYNDEYSHFTNIVC